MDHKRIYDALIADRLVNVPTGIIELHHIIPKCLNGTNAKSNLVSLSPCDHFIAHLLLCMIYPDNDKLLYAFNMMCNATNNQYQSRKRYYSRLYDSLKKKAHNNQSAYMLSTLSIYNARTGEQIRVKKTDEIPDGWTKGTLNKNTIGKTRYYNQSTDEMIMLLPGTPIPEGFVKGARPFTALYSVDGRVMWDKGQAYDRSVWFRTPVFIQKYVCIETGETANVRNIDTPPDGYVLNTLKGDRCLTCKHLITQECGILTHLEYENNIHWIRAGVNQSVLFSTDIGPVRNKTEYIQKSGRSLNIHRYCKEDNNSAVTSWLVNRSKLPTDWIGRTWAELGFGVVCF